MLARAPTRCPLRLSVACLVWALALGAPAAVEAQGLAGLYAAALASNPNLMVRGWDVERARAESDIARSALLPQVSAVAEWTANELKEGAAGGQHYGGNRGSLVARQSLFDRPAQRRLEASRATLQQRSHELAQTRQTLLDEVLDRYLQVLNAQDTASALAAEAQASARQIDRLRAMRERQMVKITDLIEAEAYALGLVTRQIDAGNAESTALARLTELCGSPVTQVAPLLPDSPTAQGGTLQALLAAAQRSHPRLLALAHAAEAAQRSIEAGRAEHLPQVTAALSYVHANTGFDNRRAPSYDATSLGLEIRLPLYEGGRVEASVREASARLGAARQQLEAARREIEREILTLWLSAQANQARIASTAAEVQALEQTVQAQQRALDLGVARVTDVLIARQRLLKAMADRATARYDHVRDLVALKTRSGEWTDADVALWGSWFGPNPR